MGRLVVNLTRDISIELLKIETTLGEMHLLKWHLTFKVQIFVLNFQILNISFNSKHKL